MNRFFTLLLAATCLTAVGQVTYPYNPDGNADGDIAVGDLQDFLVTYGNPFSPSEIMVGDSSLTYWVEQLSQTVQEQQEMIDSLSSLGNTKMKTRSWPLGQSGRVVNHVFSNGSYTVPEDSVLFITFADSFIISGSTIEVSAAPSGNVHMNSKPLPVPSGAVITGNLGLWFSGIVVKNQVGLDVVLWDFAQGAYTVPNEKIFIPRWTDESWGQIITGFLDTTFPVDHVAYWLDEVTFPEGASLIGNDDAGQMIGYLLDEDYFDTPLQESEEETTLTIDWSGSDTDTLVLSGSIEKVVINLPHDPDSLWKLNINNVLLELPFSEVLDNVSQEGFFMLFPVREGFLHLDVSSIESERLSVEFSEVYQPHWQKHFLNEISLNSSYPEFIYLNQNFYVKIHQAENGTIVSSLNACGRNLQSVLSDEAIQSWFYEEQQGGNCVHELRKLSSGDWVKVN